MKTRQPPQPPKRISLRRYLFFATVFTVGAVGFSLYINRETILELQKTYKSREEARRKIEDTKQLITRLTRQQQSLSLNGIESQKQMRERLQMHLPGEQVIYFEKEPVTTATQSTTTSITPVSTAGNPVNQSLTGISQRPSHQTR